MKRLQVGDECYVRDIETMTIKRKIFDLDIIFGCKMGYCRLVYPYPIIKQLAK
jgi:hypothetical protein